MSTTKLIKIANLDMSFDDELLLRLVVDAEFRNEILVDTKASLPSPVYARDLSFVELVKSSEETEFPDCRQTCGTGYTIRCDVLTGQLQSTPGEPEPLPGCTCVSGFTIICDGSSNAPSPPSITSNPLGISFCGW